MSLEYQLAIFLKKLYFNEENSKERDNKFSEINQDF